MNRNKLIPVIAAILLAVTSFLSPSVAQSSAQSGDWGEFRGFPIVFPPDFDRPRIGQEFPYLPALRTDTSSGLKRWVIPSEVTLADLRYAPFPSYNPAELFKNVPRSPVDNRILGGPIPVVNYIPDWFANNTCDTREDLSNRGDMIDGYNMVDYLPSIWISRLGAQFMRTFLPNYRNSDEAFYGMETKYIRRACALRQTVNAAIFYFQNLPIFYPPKRYRSEVFNRLPAKPREHFNNIIVRTPNEFPQVFFFSKDPSDPLFAVLEYDPLNPDTALTMLPARWLYVGNRTSLGIGLNTSGQQIDFRLLTVNPDNLCYIVNYNNRGAPFAFCGFDVNNPPLVSLYLAASSEHWQYALSALPEFHGFSVLNIPMVRVPQASKFFPYQEYRATQAMISDTGLRMIAWAYPPYVLALAERDSQAGAQMVRKYSGKPFLDAYILLRNEVEQRIARGALPFVSVQPVSPQIAARTPITTLVRFADARGHAAHLPVIPNTLVRHHIASVVGDHPTAVDARANHTYVYNVFYGQDYVVFNHTGIYEVDHSRLNAYNPDMKLKRLPGENVLPRDFYLGVAKDARYSRVVFYDYRNGVISRAQAEFPDNGADFSIRCVPLAAYSTLGPPANTINLAALLQFAQPGTGNVAFETPALRYAFTDTVNMQGNALGAMWVRDVKTLTFPWPYPSTYPDGDTLINNREGKRVRATMWITYAQGAPQAVSISKTGRRDERLTVSETLTIIRNIAADSPQIAQYFMDFYIERNGKKLYTAQDLPSIPEKCRAEYVPFIEDFNKALDTWFPGKERNYAITWRPKFTFNNLEVEPNAHINIFVRAGRDEVNALIRAQPVVELNGRRFEIVPTGLLVSAKDGQPVPVYVEREIDGWSQVIIVERRSERLPYFEVKK